VEYFFDEQNSKRAIALAIRAKPIALLPVLNGLPVRGRSCYS
jgi:hypothetical protein